METEGRLLIFATTGERSLILFGDNDPTVDNEPSVDEHFVSWFSREFFSRRFMVLEMWRTVLPKWKWMVLLLLLLSVCASIAIAVWPDWPPNPLRWRWLAEQPPEIALFGGAVVLMLAILALVGGVMIPKGGERFAYPFLLRFAAGTVIGSVAVVATRGVWIVRFSNPSLALSSDCPPDVATAPGWVAPTLAVGLVGIGLIYLLVEARIHGTSGLTAARRAGGVSA